MMRKQVKITHVENMFGHTYQTVIQDAPVILAQNLESDWRTLHGRVGKNYFWFRAPKINLMQIGASLQHLRDLSNKFEFKLWHDADTDTWDASLKLADDMDAASWAWSHTEMWAKWTKQAETELVKSRKQKPAKIRVSKSGRITVKATVSTIPDA